MNKSEAENLARSLMAQHGLSHLPFKFDRAKNTLGSCGFSMKGNDKANATPTHISLSAHWIQVLTRDEATEIIKHEIAHAKAGYTAGHGLAWKREARALGIADNRCHTPTPAQRARMDNEIAPHAWVGTCP